MKIAIGGRRNRGTAMCLAVFLGLLVLIAGGLLIWIIMKSCQCIKPRSTNDEPELRMQIPLVKPFGLSVPIPSGAIQIQRSTDLGKSNWVSLGYMTMSTNGGVITLTTFDSNGAVTGSFVVQPGQTNRIEVMDMAPVWPDNYYRTVQ